MSNPAPEVLLELAARLPADAYEPMAELLASLAGFLRRRAQEEHLKRARSLEFGEVLHERAAARWEREERPKFEKMRRAMQLAATGLTDPEIAQEMGESLRTVQRLIQTGLRMRREPPHVAVLIEGEPVMVK